MSFETIRLECDARGVARLTLALPRAHNALSGRMIDELGAAARALAADASVRVVVLAAEGASFCAGADLGWMRAQFEAARSERIAAARALADMLAALDTLPKPLIARVQGPAYGGGVGLLAVCDFAVGSEAARVALTETRLGLIPATISPYVAARVGAGAARRLFLSPRRLEATQAQALGLLARVVAPDALDVALEEEVAALLEAAPGALAAAKRLARDLAPPIDAARIEATIARLADQWESAEAREGVSAFFEKRAPSWRAERDGG